MQHREPGGEYVEILRDMKTLYGLNAYSKPSRTGSIYAKKIFVLILNIKVSMLQFSRRISTYKLLEYARVLI